MKATKPGSENMNENNAKAVVEMLDYLEDLILYYEFKNNRTGTETEYLNTFTMVRTALRNIKHQENTND